MSMLEKRYASDAVSLNGKIYVVGGYRTSALSSVERYDPAINQWEYVANMIEPRCGHRCCSVDNSIYAIGGGSGRKCYTSIEKYDPQIDKWTMVSMDRSFILSASYKYSLINC